MSQLPIFPAPNAATGAEKMAKTKIVEHTRSGEGVEMAMLTDGPLTDGPLTVDE